MPLPPLLASPLNRTSLYNARRQHPLQETTNRFALANPTDAFQRSNHTDPSFEPHFGMRGRRHYDNEEERGEPSNYPPRRHHHRQTPQQPTQTDSLDDARLAADALQEYRTGTPPVPVNSTALVTTRDVSPLPKAFVTRLGNITITSERPPVVLNNDNAPGEEDSSGYSSGVPEDPLAHMRRVVAAKQRLLPAADSPKASKPWGAEALPGDSTSDLSSPSSDEDSVPDRRALILTRKAGKAAIKMPLPEAPTPPEHKKEAKKKKAKPKYRQHTLEGEETFKLPQRRHTAPAKPQHFSPTEEFIPPKRNHTWEHPRVEIPLHEAEIYHNTFNRPGSPQPFGDMPLFPPALAPLTPHVIIETFFNGNTLRKHPQSPEIYCFSPEGRYQGIVTGRMPNGDAMIQTVMQGEPWTYPVIEVFPTGTVLRQQPGSDNIHCFDINGGYHGIVTERLPNGNVFTVLP